MSGYKLTAQSTWHLTSLGTLNLKYSFALSDGGCPSKKEKVLRQWGCRKKKKNEKGGKKGKIKKFQ